MRTIGSENKTPKYNCMISLMGDTILDKDFTTLKKLSEEIEMPYYIITDIYEGRRTAYKKFTGTKYFPDLVITRIDSLAKGEHNAEGTKTEKI